MNKRIYNILYGLIFIFTFLIIISLSPNTVSASKYGDYQRVYDDADLLSTDEWEELNQMSIQYGDEVDIKIYILTHNDSYSILPEEYIEEFDMQFPPSDSVYFLYDLYRKEIFIEGYGLAEIYLHSNRIDNILDDMVDDLKAGNYYEAFYTYIITSSSYMLDDSDLNYDHNYDYEYEQENYYDHDSYYDKASDSYFNKIWIQILISLSIGLVAVLIMASNSGGKVTVKGHDYLDRSRPGLIGRRDTYLRTRTTRVKKPKQQNHSSRGGGSSRGSFNSSGNRGGVSRGGRSHSSGGRKL